MKLFFVFLFSTFLFIGCQQQNVDWSSYGNDLTNQRFSRLDQINTTNVDQLKLAWQYRTGIRQRWHHVYLTTL